MEADRFCPPAPRASGYVVHMPVAPIRSIIRRLTVEDALRLGIAKSKVSLFVLLECGHARPLPNAGRRRRAECLRCMRQQPVLAVVPSTVPEVANPPPSRPVEGVAPRQLPAHYFVLKVTPERCLYCQREAATADPSGCSARRAWDDGASLMEVHRAVRAKREDEPRDAQEEPPAAVPAA